MTSSACQIAQIWSIQRKYVVVILDHPVNVNSEIFARILVSRNFAYANFRESKTLAKW